MESVWSFPSVICCNNGFVNSFYIHVCFIQASTLRNAWYTVLNHHQFPQANTTLKNISIILLKQLSGISTTEHRLTTSWHGNTFRITGSFVRGICRSPVDSPHKGEQLCGVCCFLCYWNKQTSDCRRFETPWCDVTIMGTLPPSCFTSVTCSCP